MAQVVVINVTSLAQVMKLGHHMVAQATVPGFAVLSQRQIPDDSKASIMGESMHREGPGDYGESDHWSSSRSLHFF
jgi:hypothetical protein